MFGYYANRLSGTYMCYETLNGKPGSNPMTDLIFEKEGTFTLGDVFVEKGAFQAGISEIALHVTSEGQMAVNRQRVYQYHFDYDNSALVMRWHPEKNLDFVLKCTSIGTGASW